MRLPETLRRPSILIFAGGTAVALLLWGAALLFLNPPQCPFEYTQEQVDASNCIIGANIGLGLVLFLVIGLWVATTLVAGGFAIAEIIEHVRLRR